LHASLEKGRTKEKTKGGTEETEAELAYLS
jgi:hypothetical protein